MQNNALWHFFPHIEALSLKNASLPLIFFSDSNNSCQELLFPRGYKPRKNTIVSAGTPLIRLCQTIPRCAERMRSSKRNHHTMILEGEVAMEKRSFDRLK